MSYLYLCDLINDLSVLNNHIVTKITKDSRNVCLNAVFICENIDYLLEGINKGAKTIITNFDVINTYLDINIIKQDNLKEVYQTLLKKFYQNYQSPYLIGLTGTCGKTTTSTILYRVLKQKYNPLLIGSNGIYYQDNDIEIKHEINNTTPSLEIIYEFIYLKRFDYVIIEVSSQGLDDGRVEGLSFDLGVFLNLSSEHLDHHINMDNYFQSKLKLFKKIKEDGISLINSKLLFKEKFYQEVNSLILEFDDDIELINDDLEKMKIKIEDKYLSTSLNGVFNLENINAVNKICEILKIDKNDLYNVLENDSIIDGRNNLYKINSRYYLIDFAHTEEEVKAILQHLHIHKINRLLVVIGCGGDRDKLKRPKVGKYSSLYSDYVIYTKDENRSERTIDIIKDILKGVKSNNYKVILSRFNAIKEIINYSIEEDIIAIIGMGNDLYFVDELDQYVSDLEVIKLLNGGNINE